MNEARERDLFVNLLRPVLLKIVSWINKNFGHVSKCASCGQSIVKFEN